MIDAYSVLKNRLLGENAPSFALATPCLMLKKLYMQAFRISWSLMKVFLAWAGYSVCHLFRPPALHVVPRLVSRFQRLQMPPPGAPNVANHLTHALPFKSRVSLQVRRRGVQFRTRSMITS